MRFWLPLEDISDAIRGRVGGKAAAMATLARDDIRIPRTYCIPIEAYRAFTQQNSLAEKIHLELHRKDLADMRWEEMWDASHRIRGLFQKTRFPPDLANSLTEGIESAFGEEPVAVRSSGLGEDAARASFAGVHDSYLDIRGAESILMHVRLVWASLWSDAALLYRSELGLELHTGAMAVLVQEFIPGNVSGVVFSQNPMDPGSGVIEAVSGLNRGLVDGTEAPDRWFWDRSGGLPVPAHPPSTGRSLLTPSQLIAVKALAEQVEAIFGRPQDTEWTYRKRTLFTLQSRPITTLEQTPDRKDKAWQLSLRRSFENLEGLAARIEKEIIPKIILEAEVLHGQSLSGLADSELNREIRRRRSIHRKWKDVYWDVLIPFAHGVRLFGRMYNDVLHPEDPYEFVELLRPDSMESLKRNQLLHRMTELLPDRTMDSGKREPTNWEALSPEFLKLWEEYHRLYANLPGADDQDPDYRARLLDFLIRLKNSPQRRERRPGAGRRGGETRFLEAFPGSERKNARRLLDLARFSYRLRDDDNIYLGRIESELQRALSIAGRRLSKRWDGISLPLPIDDVLHALEDPGYRPRENRTRSAAKTQIRAKPRQIKGQPAGQGLSSGKARVIHNQQDLFAFRNSEVLVCDAIEPNMTFVVPLAAAIVERRGGMLIHGAIIAREYGIPCVTGIPDLLKLVKTGDPLTVDGYLGIVVFNRN